MKRHYCFLTKEGMMINSKGHNPLQAYRKAKKKHKNVTSLYAVYSKKPWNKTSPWKRLKIPRVERKYDLMGQLKTSVIRL